MIRLTSLFRFAWLFWLVAVVAGHYLGLSKAELVAGLMMTPIMAILNQVLYAKSKENH
jgi:hypothetical protein